MRQTFPRATARRALCIFAIALVTLSLFFPSSRDIQSASFSVGVCITGQLCRLELANKNHFFFQHLKEQGQYFHLIAVLQAGDNCGYTNDFNQGTSIFHTLQEVDDWMEFYNIDGSAMDPQLPSPIIQERYVHSLDKRGKLNETSRAMNHYKQWKSLEHCYSSLQERHDFDVFVKLRDDSVFVSRIQLSAIILAQQQNSISYSARRELFVPSCLSWGGINDKSAVVLSGAAFDFFNGPLRVYTEHFDDIACHSRMESCEYVFNVYNPESFMLRVMEFYGLQIVHVHADQFPIVTGHASLMNALVCFPNGKRQFGLEKSCLPSHLRRLVFGSCLIEPKAIYVVSFSTLAGITYYFSRIAHTWWMSRKRRQKR